MKASPLIFLLLAATQLAATAQTPPTMSYPVDTPLPMFGDLAWATMRQDVDEADSRSLQLNYYYVLTNFSIKQSFSAEFVSDTTRLVRGKAIKRQESAMYYFDEAGRRRNSYKTAGGQERILIIDRQHQLAYLVRPDREDVLRVSGAPHDPLAARRAPSEPARPTFAKQVTTQLGVKEFDGLKASGLLTESVYPAGTRGNEKEIVETSESWSLPQLGITVYSRRASPLLGESVAQFRNIKLGEPPASVFEIPANFKVRDVTAEHGTAR